MCEGDLLLKVHGVSTASLSHFETVEALKRAPRPGRLTFRPLPAELLESMRQRMHHLVVVPAVSPNDGGREATDPSGARAGELHVVVMPKSPSE